MRFETYKNSALSVEKKVEMLISEMSMKEKVAQLVGVWCGGIEDFDDTFLNDKEKMMETFGVGIHSVHPSFLTLRETVDQRNKIQKYLFDETRLGIPALFFDEGPHGLMRKDATVFPQVIGLSCSWDTGLFQDVYRIVALEMRSRGSHHVFSPNIDVCTEPRWGRVEETCGEDPYLTGVLGSAAVIGYQGFNDGTIGPYSVAATVKHFAGHGQPESGINQAPSNISRRLLFEKHLLPFKMCIDASKPFSVMPSYNEIDSVPSHCNTWLLNDILKDMMGFKGMIVSDYYGIEHLHVRQSVAENPKHAAQRALSAGVQCEFPVPTCFKFIEQLVNEKKIDGALVDNAVRMVLHQKFLMGLFDNPFIDYGRAVEISRRKEHTELALDAARKSIVLLKNDSILPLRLNEYKTIAVIGPCAKETGLGGYSGEPYKQVSLYDGIVNRVGVCANVICAQGCKLTDNSTISFYNWKNDPVIPSSADENRVLIADAVAIANTADIVILAIGENEQLCREAWGKGHVGDTHTLELFGEQSVLADAMFATGKPVIVYLSNGRPLSITSINAKANAVIEGWYMGEQAGTAAAEVIFGDISPSGKLTITFPKSVGQLPLYYNHKPQAHYLDYLALDSKPLYPFGYGLSYTTFSYSTIRLSSREMTLDESVVASIDITNTGTMDADEIVQLYIHDCVASVTRPVMELKDFKRISLKKGATETVNFTIDKGKLAFWNIDMQYVVEPGEFEIMIGRSSIDFQSIKFSVV
jgi:beta-glucosidase